MTEAYFFFRSDHSHSSSIFMSLFFSDWFHLQARLWAEKQTTALYRPTGVTNRLFSSFKIHRSLIVFLSSWLFGCQNEHYGFVPNSSSAPLAPSYFYTLGQISKKQKISFEGFLRHFSIQQQYRIPKNGILFCTGVTFLVSIWT